MEPRISYYYNKFEKIMMNILEKHAPNKRKYIRANETAYMTRPIKMTIMHRTKLKNKFIKNPSKENEIKYK